MSQVEEHEVTAGDVSERAEMIEAFDHLGPIEQGIIRETVQRLGQGAVDYGRMADVDLRDWLQQAVEESIDLNVYLVRKLEEIRFVERILRARGIPLRVVDVLPVARHDIRPTEPCKP